MISVWSPFCFAFALLLLHSFLRLQSFSLSLLVKGFPIVQKLFLLYSSLPEAQVLSGFLCLSLSLSFFSYFFCSIPFCGHLLAFLEVWGLLLVFSRCSVGVGPHEKYFMYLWGRRGSPHMTPLPSGRFPSNVTFLQRPSFNSVALLIHLMSF